MRNRYLFLLDIVLLAVTPTLALVMRVDSATWVASYAPALVQFTILALIIKLVLFFLFGLYRRYWRYASVDELVSIILAVGSAILIIAGVFFGAGILGLDNARSLPRSVPFIDGLLTLVVVGGSRFSVRIAAHKRRRSAQKNNSKAVLIVGAGDAGEVLAGPGDRHRDVELGADPLAGEADLPAVRLIAGVARGPQNPVGAPPSLPLARATAPAYVILPGPWPPCGAISRRDRHSRSSRRRRRG